VFGQRRITVGPALAPMLRHTNVVPVNGHHSIIVDELHPRGRIASARGVRHAVIMAILSQFDVIG
jgi:hypothetical protein